MRNTILVLCVCAMAQARPAHGQTPIDAYLNFVDGTSVEANPSRTAPDILKVLPLRQSQRFAEYVRAKFPRMFSDEILKRAWQVLREDVEHARLNKLVGNGTSGAGTTSLASRVAVPGFLGFATEYGGILQQDQGNTMTLRANILGLANVMLGASAYPYCPELDAAHCSAKARWLRRFSVATSFESTQTTESRDASTGGGTAPTAVDFPGSNFRLASWSARYDFNSNDIDDPSFQKQWTDAILSLRKSHTGEDLTAAVNALVTDPGTQEITKRYDDWQAATVAALVPVPPAAFRAALADRLDALIVSMLEEPDFMERVAAVSRTSRAYFDARDALLRALQHQRWSLDITNQHPNDQPWTSRWTMIYSDQPTSGPTLVTANLGATFYTSDRRGLVASALRDVHFAAQMDRPLKELPGKSAAVLTVGVYYQWMKDDRLIFIGPGNVAPGSGIVLPGTAATLLGTKGSIGVLQAKVTVPISGAVKVPFSVTYSNRTELVREASLRGQVGFTLDLDSIVR